jgi:hypothetical protein
MLAKLPDDLAQEIASLDALNLDDLRLRWQAISGRAAPSHLSRHLLSRLCSYRLQAEAYGDLSAGVSQLLDRLGTINPKDDRPIPLPATLGGKSRLKPGTVLVREHAGANHHVMVTADGYCWNGQAYSSLSQVATAITGTKWNGPRFFGLSSKSPPP